MTTHWHGDHSGGNVSLKKAFPGVNVMGGAEDNVPGCSTPIKNGDTFDMLKGQIKMKCYHTPCHTRGHICYYLEADGCQDGAQHETVMKNEYMIVSNINRCVFTGDTVFIGGCGYFMEGDAHGMLAAMDVINTLPNDTKVFVGHEYTLKNLEFCKKAEGATNPNIAKAKE